jgi:hypothetical protein
LDDFSTALNDVEKAIQDAVPPIVRRHRSAGVLTWRLMHQIESEVIAAVDATGLHSRKLLGMMRSSPIMNYPKDDREVSLEGHEVVPIVFSEIHKAWRRVD